jgi:hypothetical protein
MKTENEFSEYFLIHCTKNMKFSEDLHFVSKNYWSDLTSHLPYFFSHEARLSITEIAAEKFCQEVQQNTFQLAWQNVIRDFNKNNFWGFQQILIKPKAVKNEEQKIFWQLFKYTWAFFQSMIILKIAVYYFGLESASHPDQVNVIWVWFFFSLSAGSLGYFAYRNRND